MNFNEELTSRHALSVMRKKERIEMLEALLATHEAIGAEPNSIELEKLKARISEARMELRLMGVRSVTE
jgi:hypothetical protein